MSGLINGAGSRSGVIGTTELDYEEGEWTPAWTSTSATPSVVSMLGNYTRIGNICNFGCTLYTNGMSGTLTNAAYVTGLPFTSSANARDSAVVITTTFQVYFLSGRTFFGGEAVASDTKLFICQLGDDLLNTSITPAQLADTQCIFQVAGWYKIG
tara:strand:- start:355 stop:819 length:465 start_codon:yes stop_codon:yes gene_type:complete